jgi:hypothetical protein
LLEIHAAGLALPACARADYEIMRPACDRLYELRHERWNVAAIAIEKHYHVTFPRNRAGTCSASPTVTTRRSYDARPGFTRPVGCAISAAVINHNHFDGDASREAFANHIGDRFFLV